VILPSDKYPTEAAARRIGYFDRLEAQLRSIPGIEEVSVASSIPVDAGSIRAVEIEGQKPAVGDERVQFLSIGSNYFPVMKLAPVTGRGFNDRDDSTGPAVALVNQRFADTFWSGEEPLGRRLRSTDRNAVSEWRIVVGVVPNIMQGDPVRQQFKPLVYVPFRQDPTFTARRSGGTGFRGANLLLRTTVPPEQLARAIRSEVQNAEPDALLEEFRTLQDSFVFDRDRMDLAHADLGKHAAVAPALASVAVLLAAIGLFAVIARAVTQRTREIGVRIAIGAKAGDISHMVLRDALWPLMLGMSAGAAASLVINRLLQSQLVGVSPYDPVTMIGAPFVLTIVAMLACWGPIRRALRVDPIVALRDE
jgi:predicted permease